MINYSEILNKLINKEKNRGKEKKFLSMYIDGGHKNKEDLCLVAKSRILTGFRSEKELAKNTKLHRKIIEMINGSIKKLDNLGVSLAIFAMFDKKVDDVDENNIEILPLDRRVEDDFYIGNTFDLDKLVWANNMSPEALVLKISLQRIEVFEFDKSRLSLIGSEDNRYIRNRKENESLEMMSVNSYKGLVFGSGSDKVEKDRLETARGILRQSKEFVGKQLKYKYKEEFDNFVVAYSSYFSDFIHDFVQEVKSLDSRIKGLVLIDKNLDDDNKLLSTIRRALDGKKDSEEIELWKRIKEENFDNYVEGWQDVLAQARRNKIEILFVKSGVRKQGWIWPKEKLLYDKKVENSRKVKNIAPWLVDIVLANSGKVRIFKNDETKVPEVSALLRY